MYTLILVLGICAAALFLAGFARGLRNAVIEYRRGKPEPTEVPDYNYVGMAAISVVISATVIALVGVAPMWIYAGPLMVLGTAAGIGVAFFVERPSA
ncbi:hypothetical protein [Ancylobacter mangrovi]|uniref:Uncharacterized protein n=1 Tax=Ancylobacter mangrovi TaxID=2972472 RepID=A0A9X2PPY4_9HYPH|nr:hypothetical protein [Ancylobacter mangrovi]MCS0497683.1 hypothetical protein [Ancylobacter mangrovi]MCS0503254.1 hypothetical protein [Ancylobacter mangrovi]